MHQSCSLSLVKVEWYNTYFVKKKRKERNTFFYTAIPYMMWNKTKTNESKISKPSLQYKRVQIIYEKNDGDGAQTLFCEKVDGVHT